MPSISAVYVFYEFRDLVFSILVVEPRVPWISKFNLVFTLKMVLVFVVNRVVSWLIFLVTVLYVKPLWIRLYHDFSGFTILKRFFLSVSRVQYLIYKFSYISEQNAVICRNWKKKKNFFLSDLKSVFFNYVSMCWFLDPRKTFFF